MERATATATREKRRRRRPEDARREILDAADRLFRRHPSHEVTVTMIMGQTTLSRKSFYVYFRDRHELISELVRPLRRRGDEAMRPFLDPGRSAITAGREALLGVARLYAEHGELLRALAEAAGRDPEAARAWRGFVEPVRDAVVARVRGEVEAGRVPPDLDVEETVRALMAMNLACFFDQLAGRPEADVEGLVSVLHRIWTRVLYGIDPGAAGGSVAEAASGGGAST